jgi:hypothetical protein
MKKNSSKGQLVLKDVPPRQLVLKDAPPSHEVAEQLSGRVLADLMETYAKYGKKIFDQVALTNPLVYFRSMVDVAKVTRVQADVVHHHDRPQSIDEIRARLKDASPEVRAAFEHFLEALAASRV